MTNKYYKHKKQQMMFDFKLTHTRLTFENGSSVDLNYLISSSVCHLKWVYYLGINKLH